MHGIGSMFVEEKKKEKTNEDFKKEKLKNLEENAEIIRIDDDDDDEFSKNKYLEIENTQLNSKVLILQDEMNIMSKKYEKAIEIIQKNQQDMLKFINEQQKKFDELQKNNNEHKKKFDELHKKNDIQQQNIEEQKKYIEELRSILNSDKKKNSTNATHHRAISKIRPEENSHKIDEMVTKRIKIAEGREGDRVVTRLKSNSVYNKAKMQEKEKKQIKKANRPSTPKGKTTARCRRLKMNGAELNYKEEDIKTDVEEKMKIKRTQKKGIIADTNNEDKQINANEQTKAIVEEAKQNKVSNNRSRRRKKIDKCPNIFKIEKVDQKNYLSDNEDTKINLNHLKLSNEANELSLVQKMDDPKSCMPGNFENRFWSDMDDPINNKKEEIKNNLKKTTKRKSKEPKSKIIKTQEDEIVKIWKIKEEVITKPNNKENKNASKNKKPKDDKIGKENIPIKESKMHTKISKEKNQLPNSK